MIGGDKVPFLMKHIVHVLDEISGLADISDSSAALRTIILPLKESRLRQLIYNIFDIGWYLLYIMVHTSCALPYPRFR